MHQDMWDIVVIFLVLCILSFSSCDNSGGYAGKYTDAGIYYD